MKIFTILWASYLPLIRDAANELSVELAAYSTKQLNLQPDFVSDAILDMGEADLILLYRTSDAFWNDVDHALAALNGRIPVVAVGSDPSLWASSTVQPELVATAYNYLLFNGRDNMANMLKFLFP